MLRARFSLISTGSCGLPPKSFVAVREDLLKRLENADWRVLSAARADQLLRDKLGDRVYAVKVCGFA